MHYYSFHVSDYIHDTAHLSNEEDLAFRRLLDLYYTQEKPIPNRTQEVARRIRMANNVDAVQIVLEEFFMFDLEKDHWYHKRCDETIAAYQAKAERNRQVGKLGGRPKTNHDETQTVSKTNPNQEPITNNQEPKKKAAKAAATSVACPSNVSEQVWNDWMTVRKDKRAKTLTQTAWIRFCNQVEKAGWNLEQAISHCCLKNWVSFDADWVSSNKQFVKQQDVVRVTTPTPDHAFDALRKIEADRKKAVPMPTNIREQLNGMRKMPDGKKESVGNV